MGLEQLNLLEDTSSKWVEIIIVDRVYELKMVQLVKVDMRFQAFKQVMNTEWRSRLLECVNQIWGGIMGQLGGN